MRLKYGALLGWGLVIYAVMSLAWSGLVIHGYAGTLVSRILVLCVLVAVTTIAARSFHFHSWGDVLLYSGSWAVMMGLFDAIYTVPFVGWAIYSDWNLWLGYTLVAVVPLLTLFMHPGREERHE